MRPDRIVRVFAAALVAMLAPATAIAQAPACSLPSTLTPPRVEGPTDREPKRVLPIGGYTLAVSWNPQYCRTHKGRAEDSFQCGGRNRFGFTLHGLWPDGPGKDWPQYCRPGELLAEATLRRNLCATPSTQLLQHEWAKHGTCMSPDPDSYFATSTKLYRSLRFPDMDSLSRRPLTASGFAAAFAAVNPGMKGNMIRLNIGKGGWLEEAWICLGTNMKPHRCPSTQGGATGNVSVKIWRGGPAMQQRRPRG
jgi:ribonuclease T2